MLKIPSLEKGMAVEAVKQGILYNNPFHLSISKKKITNLEQIKQKTKKFMRQEDALTYRNKNDQQSWQNDSNYNRKRDRAPTRDHIRPGNDQFPTKGRDRKKDPYTQYQNILH